MREIVSPLMGLRSPFGGRVDRYKAAGFRPTLVADMTRDYYRSVSRQTFDDIFTHSRLGNATMTDSDGLLKWGPHNLLTYSEDFSNAAWTATAGVTVDANAAVAPNGSVTANSIVFWGSSSSNLIYRTAGQDFVVGQRFTTGYFVKQNGYNWVQVVLSSAAFGGDVWANFDLENGVVGNTGASNVDQSITAIGDGWYYVTLTGDVTTSTTSGPSGVAIENSDVATRLPSWSADGTSGIYLWGAHLYRSDLGGMVNNSDRGDSYVPTTSAAVYLPRRGHHVWNGSAWVDEGLLHESEARTNLEDNSNDFSGWTAQNITNTADQATGWDGQTSMSSWVPSTGNTTHNFIRTYTTTESTDYTFSQIYKADGYDYVLWRVDHGGADGVKVTFNVSTGAVSTSLAAAGTGVTPVQAGVVDLGDGLFHCYVTFTTKAGSTSTRIIPYVSDADYDPFSPTAFTGDGTSGVCAGFVDFVASSSLSSHIPTAGSTATRAAETLTIPAANLPWPTPVVIGEELVTNGGFDTDTSGWSGRNGNTVISLVGNKMQVEAGAADLAYAYQQITVAAGSVCRLTLDYEQVQNTSRVYVGIGTGTNTYYDSGSLSGSGSIDIVFVATSANPIISVFASTSATLGDASRYDNISVKEIDPLAVSIAMEGRQTGDNSTMLRWYADANNYITQESGASDYTFEQASGGTVDNVTGGSFTSGVLQPFDFASTHASTLVAAAVSGTALTDNTTPTALADLESTDASIGYAFNGTIKRLRIWPVNITEAGREGASS